MKAFDASIIGTRQSGPSLAHRLAGAGMRVGIIERYRFAPTLIAVFGTRPTTSAMQQFRQLSKGIAEVVRKTASAYGEVASLAGMRALSSWPRTETLISTDQHEAIWSSARQDPFAAAQRKSASTAVNSMVNVTTTIVVACKSCVLQT
jgi:choline dehydrogenase-like flavoprotein